MINTYRDNGEIALPILYPTTLRGSFFVFRNDYPPLMSRCKLRLQVSKH